MFQYKSFQFLKNSYIPNNNIKAYIRTHFGLHCIQEAFLFHRTNICG